MPNELQIFVFEFEGSIETNPSQNPQTEIPYSESQAIEKLNKHSEEINQDLQKEIKRFVRAPATVQAEVTFRQGSLLVEGAIIISYWLGSLAFTAAKQAFEAEFTRIVGIIVKRVVQRALTLWAPEFNSVIERLEIMPQPASPLAKSSQELARPVNLRSWTMINTIFLILLLVTQGIILSQVLRP
jgi:hypothetical protein